MEFHFAQIDTTIQLRDIFSLITIAITSATFLWNAWVQWYLKASDTRLDFHRRYHQLLLDMTLAQDNKKLDSIYYLRYWDLQKEQFECWMDGLIPDRTYKSWLTFRHKESKMSSEHWPLNVISYEEGWQLAKHYTSEESFTKIIDTLFEKGVEIAFANAINERKKKHPVRHYLSLWLK